MKPEGSRIIPIPYTFDSMRYQRRPNQEEKGTKRGVWGAQLERFRGKKKNVAGGGWEKVTSDALPKKQQLKNKRDFKKGRVIYSMFQMD